MNFKQAMKAINGEAELVVRTRTGAEYAVGRDTLECYGEDGHVYGYRTNGGRGRPFDRKEPNGSVRWFAIKNVSIVKARDHRSES